MTSMNPLLDYAENNRGRLLHKWTHYFDIYHRHFKKFRGRSVTVVEFGVAHGGSLQMWKHYFGPEARVVGVDINPTCKSIEEDQISIRIGDQEDRGFLRQLVSEFGEIHIVIDDGGHCMQQQIATLEEMFPAVVAGGVLLMEDLHTSYWEEHGGGHEAPNTLIEYSKHLVDELNARHSRTDSLQVTQFTRCTSSMHYYDSVLVIEKEMVPPPGRHLSGRQSLDRGQDSILSSAVVHSMGDSRQAILMQKSRYLQTPNTGGDWARAAVAHAGINYTRTNVPQADSALRPVGRLFDIAFVREPWSWWQSYWIQRMRRGWDPRNNFDMSCVADNFERFLAKVFIKAPGYWSHVCESYVGPPGDEVDFLGRYENLTDDLVTGLSMAGEHFDEEQLRLTAFEDQGLENHAAGGSYSTACSEELKLRILEAERPAMKRFGYR